MSAHSELNQERNRNGDLLTAISTLQKEKAELEKRIGELEVSEAHLLCEHRRQSELIDGWLADSLKNHARAEAAEQTLTAERQRIGELEAERDKALANNVLRQLKLDERLSQIAGANALRVRAEVAEAAWKDRAEAAEQTLTAERQRREECEELSCYPSESGST